MNSRYKESLSRVFHPIAFMIAINRTLWYQEITIEKTVGLFPFLIVVTVVGLIAWVIYPILAKDGERNG